MVAVESQDTSLVRLGHIRKHNIHHTYRRGEARGGEEKWIKVEV